MAWRRRSTTTCDYLRHGPVRDFAQVELTTTNPSVSIANSGWRAATGGVHGVHPLGSGALGPARPGVRRDRRMSGPMNHNKTTAHGAREPERAAA